MRWKVAVPWIHPRSEPFCNAEDVPSAPGTNEDEGFGRGGLGSLCAALESSAPEKHRANGRLRDVCGRGERPQSTAARKCPSPEPLVERCRTGIGQSDDR
jgi:hypothetical protein